VHLGVSGQGRDLKRPKDENMRHTIVLARDTFIQITYSQRSGSPLLCSTFVLNDDAVKKSKITEPCQSSFKSDKPN
jgi:hypothetical protein